MALGVFVIPEAQGVVPKYVRGLRYSMVLIFNSWVIDEALGLGRVEFTTKDELGGARGDYLPGRARRGKCSDNTVMQLC